MYTAHLEKKGHDKWSIVVEAGRDPSSGKRVRQKRTVNGNKTAATEEMHDWVHELLHGTRLKKSGVTVAEFLLQWLESVRPRLEDKTVEGYETCVTNHLVPGLGKLKLQDLGPLHVERLQSDLLGSGLEPRTVQLVHAVLHAALKQAQAWDMVGRNVADLVKPPKVRRKEMNVLSPDEIPVFLEAAEDSPIGDLVITALASGLRRGELLELKWSDVDLAKGKIRVQRAMVKVKGKVVHKGTKTDASRRTILLDPDSVDVLRNLKARSTGGLVFCRQDGTPLDPSTVSHQFKALAKRAGFAELRFHDMRHTHATILLAAGVDTKTVQKRLGHESIVTTLNTYAHVIESMEERAVEAASRMIWHRDGTTPCLKLFRSEKVS